MGGETRQGYGGIVFGSKAPKSPSLSSALLGIQNLNLGKFTIINGPRKLQ
jgi:hypothetical protein